MMKKEPMKKCKIGSWSPAVLGATQVLDIRIRRGEVKAEASQEEH